MAAVPSLVLIPGEHVLQRVEFSPRLILRYLKVSVTLTDQRVHVAEPNTVFGVIPLGYRSGVAPLERVSDVVAVNKFSTVKVLIAALLIVMGTGPWLFGFAIGAFVTDISGTDILMGVSTAGNAIYLLLFLAIAASVLLTARTIALGVRTIGGGLLTAAVGVGEHEAMLVLNNAILAESATARARRNRADSAMSSPRIQVGPPPRPAAPYGAR